MPVMTALIAASIGAGCSQVGPSSPSDLCAGHTVLEPDAGVVRFLNYEGLWRPTDREVRTLERKLQNHFIKPSLTLGNASYSGKPPAQTSGFDLSDYFVSYEAYREKGRKFIKAEGYIQTAVYAKAWLESEARKNRSHEEKTESSDEVTVVPMRPFGGGTSTFDALYDADNRQLLKFSYGAPL